MATKSRSKLQGSHYQNYKIRQTWAINRKSKLERALKHNPENLQITAALKNISYRRKTPKTPMWCHKDINMAHLVKQFTGYCDKNIFNSNKDVRNTAVYKRPQVMKVILNTSKNMFSLKMRAHNKGILVWP